jgi:hypothetical protein
MILALALAQTLAWSAAGLPAVEAAPLPPVPSTAPPP